MTAPSRGRLVVGLLLGSVAGCLIGSVVTIPFAYSSAKAKEAPARQQWGLRPVVVYKKQFVGKEAVTYEVISMHSLPAHTVDEGMVLPDAAPGLIGRRVIGRVEADAPVRWVDVAPKEAERCFGP